MESYKDWQPACEESVYNRAVSDVHKINVAGKEIEVEIVKPERGDGYYVYAKTGYKIRKAFASEIDSQHRRWHRY